MVPVGQPFEMPAKGGWFIKLGRGEARVELGPFTTPTMAKKAATRQANALDAKDRAQKIAQHADIGEPDGTLSWYCRAMDHTAAQVIAGGGKEAREDLKALALASSARKNLHDMEAQYRELSELKALVAEMMTARDHGTRISSTTPRPQGVAGAASPVH